MTTVSSRRHTDNGNHRGTGLPVVPSIPLIVDDPENRVREQSIGTLVREATEHLSSLIRSEMELARTEIGAELRRGLKGSVLFVVALTILLFSTFFFFFALAELLADLGLYRSAAYGIVFGVMLLVAALVALLGWLKMRRLRAPERTINSLKETAAILTPRSGSTDPLD
jgi:hypothetical protein